MFSFYLSVRHSLRPIIRGSLLVKVGSPSISIFWSLQLIKDELLPEKWETKLRLLNLLKRLHLPWYSWVISFLVVLLLGLLEGIIRWNIKTILPLIGLEGSLQNDAFQVAAKIRDFIGEFIRKNGKMPNGETKEWCLKFTLLFRGTLNAEVRGMLARIEADGITMDSSISGLLDQAFLTPNVLMSVAGMLMGAGLSLSLK